MFKVRKKLVSLTLILPALAISPLRHSEAAPLFAASLLSGTAFSRSPVQMNAREILKDMRGSLAEMAFSFNEGKGSSKHQSGTVALNAMTEATRSVQELEAALHSGSSLRISSATKRLSRAVGNLQTRYELSLARSNAATKALQRFNAGWSAYSNRFVLSAQKKAATKVPVSEVETLKREITGLSSRLEQVEGAVADSAALRREVARMRRELAITENLTMRGFDYQRISFALTVLSGSLVALSATTREYYPYYHTWISGIEHYQSIDIYWAGYYNEFYSGIPNDYYNEMIIINDPVIAENRLEIYRDAEYEAIYNATNEATNFYLALPEEDLSKAVVEPLPKGVDFSVGDISIDSPQRDASEASLEATSGGELIYPEGAKGPLPGLPSEDDDPQSHARTPFEAAPSLDNLQQPKESASIVADPPTQDYSHRASDAFGIIAPEE